MVIDPLRGLGEPVVRAVRTEILAEQFRAGEQPETIAADYNLPIADVLAALRYERTQRAPGAERPVVRER